MCATPHKEPLRAIEIFPFTSRHTLLLHAALQRHPPRTAELLANVVQMLLGRLLADGQLAGNSLVRQTFGHHAGNRHFSGGQQMGRKD